MRPARVLVQCPRAAWAQIQTFVRSSPPPLMLLPPSIADEATAAQDGISKSNLQSIWTLAFFALRERDEAGIPQGFIRNNNNNNSRACITTLNIHQLAFPLSLAGQPDSEQLSKRWTQTNAGHLQRISSNKNVSCSLARLFSSTQTHGRERANEKERHTWPSFARTIRRAAGGETERKRARERNSAQLTTDL